MCLLKKFPLITILLLGFFVSSAAGQNYRDQKKLIRLKPNNIMVFGKISDPSGKPVLGATVSLFDPQGAKIIEIIPADDLGEYLFTLEKGKNFGLIIEKEGFFPYYSQFTVPQNPEQEWENNIQLPDGLRNRYTLVYPPGSNEPSNYEALEEVINAMTEFSGLLTWIPDSRDSIFALRTNRIKNKIIEAEIELSRLFVGTPPGSADQFIRLQLINSDSGEGATDEPALKAETNREMLSPDKWTLQFVASRTKLNDSELKGISDYHVFEGKDGYYRYTYGIYNSMEEANNGVAYLKGKGFSQSFAKKIDSLQKL